MKKTEVSNPFAPTAYRRNVKVAELTLEEIEAIRDSAMSGEHHHLNDLMDDGRVAKRRRGGP